MIQYVNRRKNYSFKITHFVCNSHPNDDRFAISFKTLIENHSEVPIAITNIQIVPENEELLSCYPRAWCLRHWSVGGKEISTRNTLDKIMSLSLPVEVPSLGAVNGYVLFVFQEKEVNPLFASDIKSINLKISTNRGKADCFTFNSIQKLNEYEFFYTFSSSNIET